jgi:hypothetical protein
MLYNSKNCRSKKLVEQSIVISSSANKYIVYKLETAFDVIVSHEHLEQTQEIIQILKNNTSN